MRKALFGAAVGVLALAGCSAAATPATTPTHTPIQIGEDAALIAKSIKGCDDVRAGDIALGGPALGSTATCRIDGHLVNINSWTDRSSTNLDPLLASDAHETYYARGVAWTVTLGDDPMLQYQLTNQADKLFGGAINGHTDWPNDPSAEQDIARAVTASLGGAVHHFVP